MISAHANLRVLRYRQDCSTTRYADQTAISFIILAAKICKMFQIINDSNAQAFKFCIFRRIFDDIAWYFRF